MRIPSLLIAAALLGSSAWAHGEEDTNGSWPDYLQLTAGAVFTGEADDVPGGSIAFDPGFSTGLALGWSKMISSRTGLDIEGELFYQYFAVDEDDISKIPSATDENAKTFALMLNGGLDYHFTPGYSVYGMLGIGWASEIDYQPWDSGSLSIDDDDGLAFQARLGMAYNFGGSYDFRLGYRYFQTESVDIEDEVTGETDELEVAQHSIELGFRWGL
jgi:opacity protein-like surface antigen